MRIFRSFHALGFAAPVDPTQTAVLFYLNLNRFAPDP
jgi:hypothetical protein